MISTITSYIPSFTISIDYDATPLEYHIPKGAVIGTAIAVSALYATYRLFHVNWNQLLLNLANMTPYLEREIKKFEAAEEAKNFKSIGNVFNCHIPKNGWQQSEIISHLKGIHGTAGNGKNSGAVYIEDALIDNVIIAAIGESLRSNPLHHSLSPKLRSLETEVVAMTASLFRGDLKVRGNITTGGTSSILLAVYTARQRAKKSGLTSGWEIVIPDTAHPAFDKAGEMFGVTVKRVPSPTFLANVEGIRSAINSNTILVVGSFPSFPHGIIDPIEELGEMLEKVDPKGRIGLHLDACLGGFILPFVMGEEKKLGFEIPRVTSISADTHKYGYTKKGSSLILYRDESWYAHQIFTSTDWQGGIYTTPTFEGSRDGSSIAATWAALMYIGKDQYIEIAKKIMNTAKALIKRLENHPDIQLLGTPEVMLLSFASKNEKTVNSHDILEEMRKKEWYLNPLQRPAGFHLCLTAVHANNPNFVDMFMEDLDCAVETAKKLPLQIKGKKGEAHIYGTNATFGAGTFVKEVASRYWVVQARPVPS